MSNDKVKMYKNPQRPAGKGEVVKSYTPQYVLMGVEPQEHKVSTAPSGFIAAPSTDNPRAPRPAIRQPYAQTSDSPLGRGKGPMINVGNNVDQSWVSVDGDIVDDLNDVSPDQPMIDNNQFVTSAALGVPPERLPMLEKVQDPSRVRFTRDQVSSAFDKGLHSQPVVVRESDFDVLAAIHELEEGAYLLLVGGVPFCSGPQLEIQEQARLLVFGEHELCEGNPVPSDDIVILKRAAVKIGLFLE